MGIDNPAGRRRSGEADFRLTNSSADVDWDQAKADLAADDFDNGRSAAALRRSFENSQVVVFAHVYEQLVGMARVLSDGVCNAYLLDVWTHSHWRRRGIASAMIHHLIAAVPGQHVGWQTDDAIEFYLSLGARHQPHFMSIVSGRWLENDANTDR
jgi:GNAT superfamily N-acetyltransferase